MDILLLSLFAGDLHALSELYADAADRIESHAHPVEVAELERRVSDYGCSLIAADETSSVCDKLVWRLRAHSAKCTCDVRWREICGDPRYSGLLASELAVLYGYTRNEPSLFLANNAFASAAAAHGLDGSLSFITKRLSATLPRMNGYGVGGILYRGMGCLEQERYLSDTFVQLTWPLSCARDEPPARVFADKQDNGKVVPVIVGPGVSAVDISMCSINPSEMEVLCAPGVFASARRDAVGNICYIVLVGSQDAQLVTLAEQAAHLLVVERDSQGE